jgi:uncharacterized RDD family membrane protein YckC
MYYLDLNGASAGPFPLERLRAGWKSGEFRSDTLFWQEGMPEWQPLGSIRPLLEEAAPASSTGVVSGSAMIVGGFWRRLGAFLVDVLLLALVGFGSGFFLFGFYMSLGVAGVLVGLVVATAYFGILNSRLGGGCTLGKRLLGLRVADAQGLPISLGRSVVRYLILAFPFFLLKAINNGLITNLWVAAVVLTPVVAALLAFTYLLLFNRRTRQLVHDLFMRTYVVRTTSPQPATASATWRGHLIAVGALCACTVGLTCLTPLAFALPIFRETAAVRQSLLDSGAVQAATVTGGRVYVEANGQVGSTRVLSLLVHLKVPPASPQAAAARLAGLAIKNDPVISSYDHIDISLSWGYDIGIASGVVTNQYGHSIDEWQTLEMQP